LFFCAKWDFFTSSTLIQGEVGDKCVLVEYEFSTGVNYNCFVCGYRNADQYFKNFGTTEGINIILNNVVLPVKSDLVITDYWAGISFLNNQVKWEKAFGTNEAMVGSRLVSFSLITSMLSKKLKG